ncbi:MAG: methylenetetrahydrofolate reductase [Steroidobacteraceae bacterium]
MTIGALERRLRAGEFAITAELTPPLSVDPQDLLERALPLRGLADAVNVTDGASARAHLDTLTAAALMVRSGIDPVLQLTCRDRNRIALQSLLLGAAAQGVTNLLALRGDDPSAGDQPDAKPVFDLDASALLRTAATMRDHGQLPHGREIKGRISFFLGGADMPLDPKPEWKPESLLRKLDAGAQFVQTQFCMDAQILRRYIARLADAGITERVFIIVGIAPLASARSARWIRDKLFGSIIPEPLIARLEGAADPKDEGHRIALELMHEYCDIRGVAGVHLMAPLNESAVPSVIAEFRGQATAA